MNRQEGYYWVKSDGCFILAKWVIYQKLSGTNKYWLLLGLEEQYEDSDFEHINENRIKQPGELPN